MTLRSAVAAATFVVLAVGVRAQSPEQRQADAQLATPQLAPVSVSLDLKATPVKDIVAEIAKAAGVTVRYHSAVTGLDTPATIVLKNSAVADAFSTVLTRQTLAFKATGTKSIFVYPSTPANNDRYSETVRSFPIVKANVTMLAQTLNQALSGMFGADDLRPAIVSLREPPTISVRATPDMMAKIAKLIADNDK